MKLTRWKKNAIPTIILLVISLIGIGYLESIGFGQRKMIYVGFLIAISFSAYLTYLIREKLKLKKESKDRKGK